MAVAHQTMYEIGESVKVMPNSLVRRTQTNFGKYEKGKKSAKNLLIASSTFDSGKI